jgi:hypothetical protein
LNEPLEDAAVGGVAVGAMRVAKEAGQLTAMWAKELRRGLKKKQPSDLQRHTRQPGYY